MQATFIYYEPNSAEKRKRKKMCHIRYMTHFHIKNKHIYFKLIYG